VSFSDLLSAGDFIVGTPTISVVVDSGIDPSPEDMLYLGVSVAKGSIVTQRFRLGVEGVIYRIVFQVSTNLGDVLEKACFLAVRPNADTAIPTWLPLWESTQLYPVIPPIEMCRSSAVFLGGALTRIIINYTAPIEQYISASTFLGGILYDVRVPYSYGPESYQASSDFLGGTLVDVRIPYDYSYESYASDMSFDGGTLVKVVISYSYSPENYQSSLTFNGGTLT
jgi:hypothetical protein